MQIMRAALILVLVLITFRTTPMKFKRKKAFPSDVST